MAPSEPHVQYSKNSESAEIDDAFIRSLIEGDGSDDTMDVIESIDGGDEPPLVSDKFTGERSDKVTAPAQISGPISSRKPLKSVSDKVTGRNRRSDKKDKELLDRIRKFKLPDADAPEASFSSDHTPHPSLHKTTPLTPPKQPPLCVWDHVSDRMKLACSTIALQVWFEPTSWTFNLTPEAQAKALAHPKGFTKSLPLALNRKLKDRLGRVPLYWFSVHVTKDGRAHLHGAIEGDLSGLQEIMKTAWGRWEGRGASYQVDLNPQRCDDGWADYAFEGRSRACALVGDHTFYVPDELRRRAEFVYGELRGIVR